MKLSSSSYNLPRTLILGIGNTLLTDEGIGIHVLNELSAQNQFEGDVEYLDGGTLSFTLATPIESADQFIVIDTSELKQPAGSVALYENEAMDSFITSGNKKSVHEVGLADVMSIAMLNGNLPAKRALIGIQPDTIEWGEHPTESVRNAIPRACQKVRDLMQRWQT